MENEILKWIGTLFMSISAIQVSFSVAGSSRFQSYIGFAVGHTIWAYIAYDTNEWALFTLNAGFLLVDFYAVKIRTKIINKGNKNG